MINYICLNKCSENASLNKDFYFLVRAVWYFNLMVWSIVLNLLYHFVPEERTDTLGKTLDHFVIWENFTLYFSQDFLGVEHVPSG